MHANPGYLKASQLISHKGIIYSTMPVRFLLFVVLSATFARACKCAPPSPQISSYRAIAEWQVNQTSVIFEGKVESIKVSDWPIKPVAGATISLVPRLTATFNAVHLYRGEITGDAIIETGLGAGDCGYDFVTGESYLVFAWKEESGKLSTSICSGTKLLEDSGAALRVLRGEAPIANDLIDPRTAIAKSTPSIHQLCGKINAPPEVKLSSAKVVFWRVGQEEVAPFRYETAPVHPDGSYCVDSLRPGKYLIGATKEDDEDEDEPSPRYVSYYPGVPERSQAKEVEVQGTGKTAHADFALLSRPLYSVQGYLRGVPENSPEPIQIMLLSTVQDRFHTVAPAELEPHGVFMIEDVPPGRYTIFAMTQNEDNALIFLSKGVDIDVEGNIEGFKLDYVPKK
jgi:hypothetical protein